MKSLDEGFFKVFTLTFIASRISLSCNATMLLNTLQCHHINILQINSNNQFIRIQFYWAQQQLRRRWFFLGMRAWGIALDTMGYWWVREWQSRHHELKVLTSFCWLYSFIRAAVIWQVVAQGQLLWAQLQTKNE